MCLAQGCYAALLGPRDVASGAVGPALMGTLRHFSGLDTEADDMRVSQLHACAKAYCKESTNS